MSQTLSTPSVQLAFPAGTVDTVWTFALTGTLFGDGSAFTGGAVSQTDSATIDLAPGVYTLIVSKNGISSLPSDAFTVEAPATVTLSVPDAAQKAVITTSP